MKKIILHIGMHKTGSTTIQLALKKSNLNIANNLTRYASFREENHSIPIYTMFSRKRKTYHIWKNKGISENFIEKKVKKYFEILTKDINDTSFSNLVISGEDISLLTSIEQKQLCKFFESFGCNVIIIVLVRDPYDFSISSIQQYAKGGAKKINKVNPKYRSRLEGFLEHLGKEKIYVYPYEKLSKNGLLKSFSKLIDIPLLEPDRQNESVTKEALGMIYELNNINTNTFGSASKFFTRRYIIKLIRSFFSPENLCSKLKNTGKYSLLDNDVGSDLIWLKKNFNINYQLSNDLNKPKMPVPKVDKFLAEKFFKEFGFEYNKRQTLNFNLNEFYLTSEIFFRYLVLLSPHIALLLADQLPYFIKIKRIYNKSVSKLSNIKLA